jgi:hypothetical protein
MGVTSAIRKLKSQFAAADMAVILCRILRGAISAEYMNGIKNNPMGKKARARKSNNSVAPATLLLTCEYFNERSLSSLSNCHASSSDH